MIFNKQKILIIQVNEHTLLRIIPSVNSRIWILEEKDDGFVKPVNTSEESIYHFLNRYKGLNAREVMEKLNKL